MNTKLILVLTYFWLGLNFCDAQETSPDLFDTEYAVSHYNAENGLPQNSVKNIAKDSNGFIWFTTESGLVRFDGLNFYVFDKSNTPLRTTRFVDFQPDLAGQKNKIYAQNDDLQKLIIENGLAIIDTLHDKQLGHVPYAKDGYKNTLFASGFPNPIMGTFGKSYKTYILLSPGKTGCFLGKITGLKNWGFLRSLAE